MSGAPPRDPLLVYAEEVFGPSAPASATSDDDPLLAMWRRHLERVERARRRELLLQPDALTPAPVHVLESYHGAPGRRTPEQRRRWDRYLETMIRVAKVYPPLPLRPVTANVYR